MTFICTHDEYTASGCTPSSRRVVIPFEKKQISDRR
jgi:hypothetical protein